MERETCHRLRSAHLQNERTLWVRRPPAGARPRHLALVLDAELYRDGVNASAIIDTLENERRIGDTLFVFVSTASAAARWLECPCYPPFARFVLEELLPFIETLVPAAAAAHERVIVGLSYTGLAVAFVAAQPTANFTRVIAQSGSFWSNDCWLAEHIRQTPPPARTAFHLDVGTRETATHVRHKEDLVQTLSQIEGVHRFRDALLAHGRTVRYVEFDGGHDFKGWAQTLPDALAWALPA